MLSVERQQQFSEWIRDVVSEMDLSSFRESVRLIVEEPETAYEGGIPVGDPLQPPAGFEGIEEFLQHTSFDFEHDGRGWSENDAIIGFKIDGHVEWFYYTSYDGDCGDDWEVYYMPDVTRERVREIFDKKEAKIMAYNASRNIVDSMPPEAKKIQRRKRRS